MDLSIENIYIDFGIYIGVIFLGLVSFGLYKQFKKSQIAQTLLSSEHFLELSAELINLRKQDYIPEEPKVIITSQGLILTYMFNFSEDINLFLHHFSLTSKKIQWDSSVQKKLISFICTLLEETPPDKAHLSDRNVLHFSLVFNEQSKHNEYISRNITAPSVPKSFIDPRSRITVEKIKYQREPGSIQLEKESSK